MRTKMKKLLLALAVTSSIIGCAPAPQNTHGQWFKADLRDFHIQYIDRPKHFHADVVDLKTNSLFQRIAKQKHCSNHGNWNSGQRIQLKANYWRQPDGKVVFTIDNQYAKAKFCG